MSQEINLHITLLKPTADVHFGIQKGSGNKYETILKQTSAAKDLQFEFTVIIKPGKNGMMDFFGPIVQGNVGERFVYIDIGTYAAQTNSIWGRRLKIPLYTISQEDISKLLADDKIMLYTHVNGIGKDGGPNCGTVKPFEGWKIKTL